MTQLLERAIREARQLSESDQDSIAWIILQEIDSERHWEELFSRTESADLLSRMADKALVEIEADRSLKRDLNER